MKVSVEQGFIDLTKLVGKIVNLLNFKLCYFLGPGVGVADGVCTRHQYKWVISGEDSNVF